MIALVAACFATGLVVLGLYHFGRQHALLLLIVFVATNQFLQNLFASTIFVDLFGSFAVSPGSAVLFPSVFLALLLLAIHEGILAARKLIYAILAANLFLTLIVGGARLAHEAGVLRMTASSDWLNASDITAYLIGTGLLILDSLLLIILYQTLNRLRFPLPLRVIVSLLVILGLDSIVFVLSMTDRPPNLLAGQLIGKSVAAVVYGTMLSSYLYTTPPVRQPTLTAGGGRFEWLDVFSILRYRERYQDLQRRSALVERRAEEQIRVLLDSTVEAIIGLDRGGRCTFSNPAALRMLGYSSSEELQGKVLHSFAHPPGTEATPAAESCPICSVATTGESRSGADQELRRSDGTIFPVEFWSYPVSHDGTVVGAVITFLDISDRKRAEATLSALERRYRSLFSDAPEMYLTTSNQDGTPFIVDCNVSFLETLGYSREQVLGQPLAAFYSEDSRRQLLEGGYYEKALRGELPQTERELVGRSGERVQTILRASPEFDSSGEVVGTRAIYVDITERKRTEDLVRQSRERLRKLAGRLETIREEERKSLARQMHDELGQALTALRFDLSWVQMRVADQKPLSDRVTTMITIVDDTIDAVRDLSARLRPHVLDSLGLAAAIDWEVEQFCDRSGLAGTFETDPADGRVDAGLGADEATAMFRILQEGLTNVARHAGASHVWVHLRRFAGRLELEVLDDGRGIRDEEISSVYSSGLIGIRERVGALGGAVELGIRPEGGTRLCVGIPL